MARRRKRRVLIPDSVSQVVAAEEVLSGHLRLEAASKPPPDSMDLLAGIIMELGKKRLIDLLTS